jgi:hypothetical protein
MLITSSDDLCKGKVTGKYKMELVTAKTKILALKYIPVGGAKILLNDEPIRQVSSLNTLVTCTF